MADGFLYLCQLRQHVVLVFRIQYTRAGIIPVFPVSRSDERSNIFTKYDRPDV